MISKKKTSTLKNLEVATCYSKDFSKEFRSNLTYFKNNWFRELISRNYLNVIKCVIIFYAKATINYNLIVTMISYSTVIFGTRQIILNISCPVFWIRHNIFPDILNEGVYGILFTLAQNAYLYTPVFSYALYIPVFVSIPRAYKIFYFPYSAMFYVEKFWIVFAIYINFNYILISFN